MSASIVPFQSDPEPIALVDLNVPQLVEAGIMLDQCQARYDKLSGICGTMRGGVFTELKRKVGHGHFLPILAQSFSKTRKTAAQDMRLWAEFCKCNPRVTFETLGRDLATTVQEIERSNIDLRHPLVRDIAGWVDGRTRYQLLLDFPGHTGGDTSAHRKHLTAEEEHAKWLESCKADFESDVMALDDLHSKLAWQAPSITAGHREVAADLFAEMASQMRAFNKTLS